MGKVFKNIYEHAVVSLPGWFLERISREFARKFLNEFLESFLQKTWKNFKKKILKNFFFENFFCRSFGNLSMRRFNNFLEREVLGTFWRAFRKSISGEIFETSLENVLTFVSGKCCTFLGKTMKNIYKRSSAIGISSENFWTNLSVKLSSFLKKT